MMGLDEFKSIYSLPVKCGYTADASAVHLCCWSDEGNQFELHGCVFLYIWQNIIHKSRGQVWSVWSTWLFLTSS